MIRLFSTTSLVALALAGASARAQDGAAQNQQEATLPQTIPGLENFSLPSSNDRLRVPQTTPAPQASPGPAPTPTPRSTPIIRPATPPPVMIQPLPSPTQSPSPARRDEPRSRPSTAPTPAATAAPEPEAAPSPAAEATPSPAAPPVTPPSSAPAATATPVALPADRESGGSLLPVVLGLLAVAIGGLAWLFLGRRRGAPETEEEAAAPVAVPIVPPRRTVPAERPQLELVFRPRRAGMNVLSAAVDYDLAIRNTGTATARGVRVALQLFTAGERHDAEVHQFLDEPIDSPIVGAFDLAPGEIRNVHAMAMLPKAAVNIVTVKGRPMFVPMVAINAIYQWSDGQQGQTATSHIVGIAQPGMSKMQPFWLDAPARMYDDVGEHAHAIAVKR